jgi:hypothetical protein
MPRKVASSLPSWRPRIDVGHSIGSRSMGFHTRGLPSMRLGAEDVATPPFGVRGSSHDLGTIPVTLGQATVDLRGGHPTNALVCGPDKEKIDEIFGPRSR